MILIKPDCKRNEKLGGFSRYVPLSVPIGLGYLAAYLLKYNKRVKILDEEAVSINDALLNEYIRGLQKPYIFGISCLTAGIGRGHELARMIKSKYSDSKIIFGNIHPTVLPEDVLRDKNVDLVVRGEAEETLNLIYERIKNNKDYSDIEGISFRKDGTVINNEKAPLPIIENIPGFPYHLFEEKSNRYELGFIASSRGCPYDCIFCSQRSISGRKYRFFSARAVIHDIEEIIFKYKRYYITFLDDAFTINKERVIRLCEMIRQRGFHKKAMFDCQARADTVDEEILRSLKGAGFRTINFGIETASERLMELIDKKETLKDIVAGIKLTKKFGFKISGTFILGLPTETEQERKAAYGLAKELSLDYVRFNNATPYPGTKLYEIAVKENRLNPGKHWENLNACGTFVSSPFKKKPLAYVPLTCSEEELSYAILKYNLFYSFRPKSIYKILRDRVGPAGWLTLPEKWYFSIEEWIYLLNFGMRILFSFSKIGLYSISRLKI